MAVATAAAPVAAPLLPADVARFGADVCAAAAVVEFDFFTADPDSCASADFAREDADSPCAGTADEVFLSVEGDVVLAGVVLAGVVFADVVLAGVVFLGVVFCVVDFVVDDFVAVVLGLDAFWAADFWAAGFWAAVFWPAAFWPADFWADVVRVELVVFFFA